jgi:hypothetical protein
MTFLFWKEIPLFGLKAFVPSHLMAWKLCLAYPVWNNNLTVLLTLWVNLKQVLTFLNLDGYGKRESLDTRPVI